jgi:hypothetical protein
MAELTGWGDDPRGLSSLISSLWENNTQAQAQAGTLQNQQNSLAATIQQNRAQDVLQGQGLDIQAQQAKATQNLAQQQAVFTNYEKMAEIEKMKTQAAETQLQQMHSVAGPMMYDLLSTQDPQQRAAKYDAYNQQYTNQFPSTVGLPNNPGAWDSYLAIHNNDLWKQLHQGQLDANTSRQAAGLPTALPTAGATLGTQPPVGGMQGMPASGSSLAAQAPQQTPPGPTPSMVMTPTNGPNAGQPNVIVGGTAPAPSAPPTAEQSSASLASSNSQPPPSVNPDYTTYDPNTGIGPPMTNQQKTLHQAQVQAALKQPYLQTDEGAIKTAMGEEVRDLPAKNQILDTQNQTYSILQNAIKSNLIKPGFLGQLDKNYNDVVSSISQRFGIPAPQAQAAASAYSLLNSGQMDTTLTETKKAFPRAAQMEFSKIQNVVGDLGTSPAGLQSLITVQQYGNNVERALNDFKQQAFQSGNYSPTQQQQAAYLQQQGLGVQDLAKKLDFTPMYDKNGNVTMVRQH